MANVKLTTKQAETIKALASARKIKRDAEKFEAEAKAEISPLLNPGDVAMFRGQKIASMSDVIERTGFDVKRFEAEHPTLFAEYKTTTTYTRLDTP